MSPHSSRSSQHPNARRDALGGRSCGVVSLTLLLLGCGSLLGIDEPTLPDAASGGATAESGGARSSGGQSNHAGASTAGESTTGGLDGGNGAQAGNTGAAGDDGQVAGGARGGSEGDGSGGVVGSGGAVGSGGVVGSGGAVGSGGVVGSGGAVGSGGVVGSGGDVGSGGSAGSGGNTGSGGTTSTEPEPVFKKRGSPCSVSGALGCPHEPSNWLDAWPDRVICRGGVWVEDTSLKCAVGQACDRRNGACGDVIPCNDLNCNDDGLSMLRCGPDGVNLIFEFCVFGCSNGIKACISPTGDQLIVDQAPVNQSELLWPVPVVPVCVHDAAAPEWPVIRDEVNRTWGRYSALSFGGWGECVTTLEDPAAARVELSLDEACSGKLGSIDRYGYPGPGRTVSVHICRSYLDVETESREIIADENVLRFMARHEFGHVLGWSDSGYAEFQTRFMTAGVLKQQMADLVFTDRDIEVLENTYGPKPSGSLVNAGGVCLSAEGSDLTASTCNGSWEQAFKLEKRQLYPSSDPAVCLQSESAGGPLGFAACPAPGTGADAVWQAENVQWRGYRGHCVSVHPQTGTESRFWLEPCEPFPSSGNQSFGFDFLAGGKLRIRWKGSVGVPSCIRASAADPPGLPVIGSCDGTLDVFETTPLSQIHSRGYCLDYGSTRLVSVSCAAHTGQRWFFSGPLTSGALALTLQPDESSFLPEALGEPPTQRQIFDYYF